MRISSQLMRIGRNRIGGGSNLKELTFHDNGENMILVDLNYGFHD